MDPMSSYCSLPRFSFFDLCSRATSGRLVLGISLPLLCSLVAIVFMLTRPSTRSQFQIAGPQPTESNDQLSPAECVTCRFRSSKWHRTPEKRSPTHCPDSADASEMSVFAEQILQGKEIHSPDGIPSQIRLFGSLNRELCLLSICFCSPLFCIRSLLCRVYVHLGLN